MCFIFIHRLESKILGCSTWPVEVIRLNMPTPGKGGKSTKVCFAEIHTYVNVLHTRRRTYCLHFMVLPMLTLLHCSTLEVKMSCTKMYTLRCVCVVSKIVGAYLLKPFSEGDFLQKVLCFNHLSEGLYVYLLLIFRLLNPRVPWLCWVSLKLLVGERDQLEEGKR